MNRITVITLVFFTTLASILRWYLLPSHLFFGPEQGKDFLEIKKIATEHTLTLIGAKTDFDGVYHGPIYYYLASIPFFFSHGNPLSITAFFIVIQAATVLVAYAAGKEITKSRLAGIIAAFFFTVSYGAIVYSRWLSQQPLAVPISFLFLLFLFQFLHGNHRALPWVAVCAAILGQVQFIHFLFVPIFFLYVIVRFSKKFLQTPRSIISLSIVSYLLVGWGTYLAFDLRHQFLIIKSILNVFTSGQHASSFMLAGRGAFDVFIRWVGDFLGVSMQSGAGILCIILVTFLLWCIRKKQWFAEVLLAWILVPPVTLFVFRRGVLNQLFVATLPGIILTAAIGVSMLSRRFGRNFLIGVLLIFLIINIWQVWRNFPNNERVFFQTPQPDVRYSDQLEVIDEVYKRVGDSSFEIQAYTIPYFWQDGWTYLFWWRGMTKFAGKLPSKEKGEKLFVVIQKDRANSTFQNNWYRDTVTKWGRLLDSFIIGEYSVEERAL